MSRFEDYKPRLARQRVGLTFFVNHHPRMLTRLGNSLYTAVVIEWPFFVVTTPNAVSRADLRSILRDLAKYVWRMPTAVEKQLRLSLTK